MKFLTFLNSGCLDICLNMLKSAENVGIDKDNFIIACLDHNVYQKLIDQNYHNAYLYLNQDIVDYQNWTFDENSGFRNLVKYKWKIIKEAYKKYKKLCWVDTDIVFIQNPIEILSGHQEVLFQSDAPGSTLCSGFMVFNDTQECKELIDKCSLNDLEDDQLIVNKIALDEYRDNIALLNEDLFPNGNVYYLQNRKENAMIVHNNWMIGVDEKISKFKNEGLWFI